MTTLVEASQLPALIRYETMCKAIAECHRVDEVKALRDKARALEVYAQQARNTEAEDKAREIRVRAQRRMGELLAELPRTTPEERAERANASLGRRSFGQQTNVSDPSGRSLGHPTQASPSPYAAALEENGLSRSTANQYQKLAAIPEADFEAAVRNPEEKPTTAHLIREAYSPPQPKMDDASALWIWGRAREFERRGLSDRSPSALFQALLPNMQEDMRRLVPVLANFYTTFKEIIR